MRSMLFVLKRVKIGREIKLQIIFIYLFPNKKSRILTLCMDKVMVGGSSVHKNNF